MDRINGWIGRTDRAVRRKQREVPHADRAIQRSLLPSMNVNSFPGWLASTIGIGRGAGGTGWKNF